MSCLVSMRSCPPPGPIHPVSSVRSPTQGSRRRRQLNACNVFRRLPSYCFPLIYDLVREMRAESLASGISPFEEVPGSFNKKPALCFNILKDDLSIVASHCLQPGRFGFSSLRMWWGYKPEVFRYASRRLLVFHILFHPLPRYKRTLHSFVGSQSWWSPLLLIQAKL